MVNFNYTTKLYLNNIKKISTGVTAQLSSRNILDHFVIFLPKEMLSHLFLLLEVEGYLSIKVI